MSVRPFTCLVVGLKGRVFLEGLLARGAAPTRVASYTQGDDVEDSFSKIAALAKSIGAAFEDQKRPRMTAGETAFAVGWQYLLDAPDAELIVFHDSLLPRYRGFSPTASALIKGDSTIGVTALFPRAEVDAGPIVAQRAIAIRYPVKIAAALSLQAAAMTDLALELLARREAGPLISNEQNQGDATFSIWRDQADYRIDWTSDAETIVRVIDAVGSPYGGARTHLDGVEIVIDEAEAQADLRFEIRQPGKIWSIAGGKPLVVCGQGMLRILAARHEDGQPVSFARLRSRLGA